MSQSIISILNQPIIYSHSGDNTCKCGERENCVLVASGQQVYSQLKILPCKTFKDVCNNTLGDEMICNGNFDLGPELVTNGTFTGNAAGWTLGTNWAYLSNAVCATTSAAGQKLSQTITPTNGKTYYVVYTVANYSSGDVRVTLGGTNGTTRNANGTYSELIVSGAGTDIEFARVTGNFTGCIDDVSVKLVDCWTFETGWTWKQAQACNDGSPDAVRQTIAGLVNGQAYWVSFNITSYTSGSLSVLLGSTLHVPDFNAAGSYGILIIAGAGTEIIFDSDPDFIGCIDNVSVKPINSCWDEDETTWISSADGVCHVAGNTTDLTNLSTAIVSGKYYHVTITVTGSTAGGINAVLGTNVIAPITSGNGSFDFWGTSNGTALIVRPTNDFDGCISELAIDEYCNNYLFHAVHEDGTFSFNMTPFYELDKDVFNLTDFTFNERLAFGCYKFCLVDCCSEQQTASSLLRNGDFSLGGLYWTEQNATFHDDEVTLTTSIEQNAYIEQALITTADAQCVTLSFDYDFRAEFSAFIRIYINGQQVDIFDLNFGAHSYSHIFNNIPAGAVIRIEFNTSAAPPLETGDVAIDNVVVIVPEDCQPIYDQCTPCINYQASFQCTKLVEGYCAGNAFGFAFDDSGGNNQFKLSLRAKCELLHAFFPQEQDDYDFSTGSSEINFGQSTMLEALTFYPIPNFKHRVLALEKICDTFQIDTIDYFCKKGDYTPEWNKNTSTDLAPAHIDVKKKDQTLFNSNCG